MVDVVLMKEGYCILHAMGLSMREFRVCSKTLVVLIAPCLVPLPSYGKLKASHIHRAISVNGSSYPIITEFQWQMTKQHWKWDFLRYDEAQWLIQAFGWNDSSDQPYGTICGLMFLLFSTHDFNYYLQLLSDVIKGREKRIIMVLKDLSLNVYKGITKKGT